MLNQKNENNELPEKQKGFQRAKRAIASVVIAIIIWVLVVNVVNPRITVTAYDIPISFSGESYLRDKGFVIVNREQLPELSVKVSGTRADLLENMKRISVKVDVTGIEKRGSAVVSAQLSVPQGLSVQKQDFSTITLDIEPRYDKEVPVEIQQVGDGALEIQGKIACSVPEHSKVNISGFISDVENIRACIVTLDVSEYTSDVKTFADYKLVDESGKVIPENTSVYCEYSVISVSTTLYDRHTVDIQPDVTDPLAEKYKIEFDARDLNRPVMDIGVAPKTDVPEKIVATIPYEEYEPGEHDVILTASVPDGVYVPGDAITLRIKVTPKVESEKEIKVKLENIPDNLEAEKEEFTIKTKVTIPENEEGEISATINCKDFKEGENDGELKLDNKYITVKDSSTVKVIMRGKN